MPGDTRTASISRRDFLKASAAAVPVAATANAAVADPKIQYGMLIDIRRCIGCHGCSVACKAEFEVPLGATRSWVEYVERGAYPDVRRSFLPRLCNQCSNPYCVPVCPTGATYKRDEDGIVIIDPEICIGCGNCILACPYDVRFLNPDTGVAEKCDFCIHRVSKGLAPACVEACIGNARIFGDLNDPDSEISRQIATHPVSVLRQGVGTEPNVYYIDADHAGEREREQGQYIRITTHRKQQERR